MEEVNRTLSRTNTIPREKLCKTAVNKTGIPGYEYCINPYTGCLHACRYCYASFMCRFSGHREKWGDFLDVKINLPEILMKQLNRRNPPKGKVLLGSVTDVYQPDEAQYKITRSILEILVEYRLMEVHILTKSSLVQRDISLLHRLPGSKVGFTITTMDQNITRIIEPGASPPDLRLAAAQKLIKEGIQVWVFIAPLLPGLSDTEKALTKLLENIHHAGIREILVDNLNPYPVVIHNLKITYRRYFPWAMSSLDEYLQHPMIYQDKIKDRFYRISGQIGCRPYFV